MTKTRPIHRRVLAVEDDAEMQEVYRRLFARCPPGRYSLEVVPGGEQALDTLRLGNIDAVLLDWNLPGISGLSLLRALRADPKTRSLGVLMVTALTSKADELTALTAGADDHIVKPFDEHILMARLDGVFRRREAAFHRELPSRYPGLRFDPDAGDVRLDGRPVRLTPKETDLLALFLQRPDVLHAPSYLWSSLWDYESEQWNHLLVATISSLRRKLGPRWGARLRASRGRGYLFRSGR